MVATIACRGYDFLVVWSMRGRSSRRINDKDYTSAALHTRARSSYGYYEVKARPINSGGSSSFWFQMDETPGWGTEIDVFEIGGKAIGFIGGGVILKLSQEAKTEEGLQKPHHRIALIVGAPALEVEGDIAIRTHLDGMRSPKIGRPSGGGPCPKLVPHIGMGPDQSAHRQKMLVIEYHSTIDACHLYQTPLSGQRTQFSADSDVLNRGADHRLA